MTSKRDIINQILIKDNELGHFWKNGQYRYSIKFYYGKLEKYNKDKLLKILSNLKK